MKKDITNITVQELCAFVKENVRVPSWADNTCREQVWQSMMRHMTQVIGKNSIDDLTWEEEDILSTVIEDMICDELGEEE